MLDVPCKFLESLHRFDLSMLLSVCEATMRSTSGQFVEDEWFANALNEWVVVQAPSPVDEALKQLPPADRKRVAEAVSHMFPSALLDDHDISVESLPGSVEGAVALLAELLIHRSMMVSVATGGPRIQ